MLLHFVQARKHIERVIQRYFIITDGDPANTNNLNCINDSPAVYSSEKALLNGVCSLFLKTMHLSTNDLHLFKQIERYLYVPVISDSLDALGCRDHTMHPRIRPLKEDFVFAGRARTVQWMYMYGKDPNPYEVEIKFMDSLKPGDVVIPNSDPSLTNAPWGELMSTAAVFRGAKGAIIDSCVRDVKKIFKLNFPVFATAIAPLDSAGRGKVVAYDVDIESGGVQIEPGDLVVADYDGVAVVPKSIEKEVLKRSFDKVTKETKTRNELRKGKPLGEVYAKYGVL